MKRAAALLLLCGLAAAASPERPATGLFEVYAQNRAHQRPNQITEDFLLLSYAMITERVAADWEKREAIPGFGKFIEALARHAEAAPVSEAVVANRQFLRVLSLLLAGSEAAGDEGPVGAEMALIRGAKGVARSPLLLQDLDYSQFRLRGRYAALPEMSRYFQAMKYANTALFYVKDSQATGIDAAAADRLTGQAVLLAGWMRSDAEAAAGYARFTDAQAWMFGPGEDLRVEDLAAEQDRAKLLERARTEKRQPRVLAGALNASRLEPGVTAQDAMTGFRLMPGSFTPLGAAAQRLVYPAVGRYLGAGHPLSATNVDGTEVKGFPLLNENMALLGSAEALKRLQASGDIDYAGYGEASESAKKALAEPAGVASAHIALLRGMVGGDGSGQRLDTALGFATWLLHGAVLYAKQSYTGIGKGLEPADERTSAWIEPSTELYAGLRALADEWSQRLGSAEFRSFGEILERCIDISEREKQGATPKGADAEFLNGLDLKLAELTGGPDHPVAIDVHTDLNSGQALTEATGWAAECAHGVARGARFTHEEFRQDIAHRLTDEEWIAKLKERSAKPQ